MTYSTDLSSYQTYRDGSTLNLSVDQAQLLLRLATAVDADTATQTSIDSTLAAIATLLTDDIEVNIESMKSTIEVIAAHAASNKNYTANLVDITSDVEFIKNVVTTFNVDKANALNQQTLINRLNTISTQITGLKSTSTLDSLEADVEANTALLEAIDATLTNVDTSITSDANKQDTQITTQGDILTQVQEIYSLLASDQLESGALVGLDANLGINDTLLTLIQDLRNYSLTLTGTQMEAVITSIQKLDTAITETRMSTIVFLLTDIKTFLQGGITVNGGAGAGTNTIILANDLLVAKPSVRNLTLGTANSEYSLTLPTGTRRFTLKARSDDGDTEGIIRYSFVSGVVATGAPVGDEGYYTIQCGVEDTEFQINLNEPMSIYLASPTSNVSIALKYWGPSSTSQVVPPSQVFVRNLNLISANTEYTFQLPKDTKKYGIKIRGDANDTSATVRYAFTPGIVASRTPVGSEGYYTLQPLQEDYETALALDDCAGMNIYFATSEVNVAICIKYWT